MREKFTPKNFGTAALEMIEHVAGILVSYEAQGYDLTLRQLYYQIVARGLFPEDRKWRWTGTKWVRDLNGTKNAEPNYKWLGKIVNDGRLAGLIDWDMIKDRAREMVENSHWDSPADIIDSAAQSFRIDLWEDQPNYVEVMVEKQALEGVLIPVCSALDVPFTANKGYTSQSAMYEASKRYLRKEDQGKNLYVLYLGDHDPSGIDMTRDVEDRLHLFTTNEDLEIKRLALNMDQIEVLNPPEDPAKLTDSRAQGYIRRFGNSSWELDAIEPAQLAQIVRSAIGGLIEQRPWNARMKLLEQQRAELKAMAATYRKERGE